ncbi:MAG: DUF4921 family protein, partial [Candidatus Omnitrophica bacterium]|nr:DUF4921 family protein [Candidatus Omnitrophota bacterium]
MSDLRKNPIAGNWVIVSQEQELGVKITPFPPFVTPKEGCPFCPGGDCEKGQVILSLPPVSENGAKSAWGVLAVPNHFPVLNAREKLEREGLGMFDRMSGVGAHEIIIDSPTHEHMLRDYSVDQCKLMLQAWKLRIADLYHDSRFRYVAIFRNQGRRAGARISHPHSQLIASPMVPPAVRADMQGAKQYFDFKERSVFLDIIDQEISEKVRVVERSEHFLAICPFASRYPFEVWILPRFKSCHYQNVQEKELADLAQVLLKISKALSASLADPDLNLVLKNAPNPRSRPGMWQTLEDDYQWRIEIIPRISRRSGYEWASGMYVNPTAP